jgi:predicted ATPase
LVLDDLHWSDVSTLDWLAYVARRRAPARLFVIGAYRPVDAVTRQHPIRVVIQDLRVHGQCQELMLTYLSESGVAAYLKQSVGMASLSENVMHAFYHRTNGNPLFVVAVIHEVARQYRQANEQAESVPLAFHPESILMQTPESLRLLLNQQLEQLPPREREYLETASVVGRDFSTAAVAASLDVSEEEAETQYAALARRGQFLLGQGAEARWDGATSARYSFGHDLYHEILYEQMPMSRRARCHRQIGAWLEVEYGPRAMEMAGEIAEHFVRGRAYVRALPYVQYAGENALRRSAPQEAIRHATIGFECLHQLPDAFERDRHELGLQLILAAAWVAANGFSSPEVEQAYRRARELARQLGEMPQLFVALYGLFVVHELRADFHDSAKLSDELLSIAEQQQDRSLLIGAHELKACTLFHTGQFVQVQEQVTKGLQIYEPGDHHALVALYGLDLGFYSLFWSALTLWLLGYPDQSLQQHHQIMALAQSASHAFSLGCAHLFATHIHCLRGESHLVREHAESLITLSTDHGFGDLLAQGTIMHGWALALHGQGQVGIAELRQGLEGYRASGQEMDRPFYLALLADAYGLEDEPETGLRGLDEALAMAESMYGYAYTAWLYQMQGDLLQAADLTRYPATRTPEDCFQLALSVARRQQAKSLELRAAISLSRLWRRQGKPEPARMVLTEVYNGFTEGLDTTDLRAARSLLEELHPLTNRFRLG